jgi:hypothetical protein
LQVVKSDKKGTQWYNWTTLFWGGFKYGDLALQVGGVSDEEVKYGSEFYRTSTQE